MQVMTNYKAELAKRGKKIRDLAQGIGMEYDRLVRIMNGYRTPEPNFDMLVVKKLAEWDAVNVPNYPQDDPKVKNGVFKQISTSEGVKNEL